MFPVSEMSPTQGERPRALVAGGVIPERETGKPFSSSRECGFHAPRHHFASVTLDSGVSIKAFAEYLGHTDPGFTLRTYAHMMPASDERMREAIDRAWASVDGLGQESAPDVHQHPG
ncbi:phage integrase family protein [Actinorugispora endophytica]|uniref:Phage integrase family protein n=1 Tax=Actinorugispora endophytica TaxID=1605990 RepID=A0A4R6UY87_9ACTN|nr:phage integrase family protein [Actinorugispora endophytica]